MSSIVNTAQGWLRRNLAWSNTRQAWEERVGMLLLVAGACGVWLVRSGLTLPQELTLWALLGITLAVLLRRGWLRLFGPMLFYDLVRVARRGRYYLLRTLFALLLAFLLCWMYLITYLQSQGGAVDAREMASFAESFFYTFMGVQFVIVVLLTPAYTAGAVAEEKERRTLEFLLATDLRNREIILSKLVSRIANLFLLILTGLPILSFLQFMGGVDPNLVLAGFTVTVATMVSLAAFSIVNSVMSKRPRDAIALTYLGALAYLLVSGASWALLVPGLGLAGWPSTDTWLSPITLDDVVHTVSIGNPIAGLVRLVIAVESGQHIADALPIMLRNYLIFHGLLTLVCAGWAIIRLRILALKQSYGKPQKVSLRRRWFHRPRVGNQPMLWKELFAEPGLRFNLFSRFVLVILVAASFVPLAFIFGDYLMPIYELFTGTPRTHKYPNWEEIRDQMNAWVRVLGTAVSCLMLLAVAARASSSVSNERDRQTFDGLLTTPLGSDNILFSKWLGNILSVRWAWVWLGLIYFLGVVTLGLHPIAALLLVVAWVIYAAVLSNIGLWFSMGNRSTLWATIWTFLLTAGAGVGHWLIWMCFIPLLITLNTEPVVFKWLRDFQVGMTPPAALGYALAFHTKDLYPPANQYRGSDTDAWEAIGFAMLGLFCWSVLAAVLWGMNSVRFRILTARMPFQRRPVPVPVHRLHPEPVATIQPTVAPTATAVEREESV
jgi:ABC-type transport system involved in multi-copper enzyme maturation permease subunit